MSKSEPKAVIEGEVVDALELQQQLATLESELMRNDQFKQFISLRNAVNEKMAKVRKDVEAIMIPAYQAGKVDKTIKGDWGSVTVTETDIFDINKDELPPKFWVKVPDTAKIRGTFQLEGKAPKGTKPFKRYTIMIKFKEAE